MRAASTPPISTVGEHFTMTSGGPTHIAISVTRAAGSAPINTVGQPGAVIGPPTCGTGPVERGQVCMSVSLAAGCPMKQPPRDYDIPYSTHLRKIFSP